MRELLRLRLSGIRKLQRATRESVEQTRARIKDRGDASIRKGGNFGARWTQGFRVQPSFLTGIIEARLRIWHTIPYASVFEYGARIQGRPLLWIPMSYTGVKIRARDYARRMGGLFYVKRKSDGLDLLLSTRTKKVIYFGKPAVRIKRKWYIRTIVTAAVKAFPQVFSKLWRAE